MIRETGGRICIKKYPTLERDVKKNMQRRDKLYGVKIDGHSHTAIQPLKRNPLGT